MLEHPEAANQNRYRSIHYGFHYYNATPQLAPRKTFDLPTIKSPKKLLPLPTRRLPTPRPPHQQPTGPLGTNQRLLAKPGRLYHRHTPVGRSTTRLYYFKTDRLACKVVCTGIPSLGCQWVTPRGTISWQTMVRENDRYSNLGFLSCRNCPLEKTIAEASEFWSEDLSPGISSIASNCW